MTDKLIPVRCGCGGEAQVVFPFGNTDMYLIECNNCGICTSSYNTEAEAVRAWNKAMGATDTNVGDKERRAKVETVEKPNVYKCSECGQYFHSTAWGSPVEYCSRCGVRLEWDE